jgi:hypothetical protein
MIATIQGWLDFLNPRQTLESLFVHGILPWILIIVAVIALIMPPITSKIKLLVVVILVLAALYLMGLFVQWGLG